MEKGKGEGKKEEKKILEQGRYKRQFTTHMYEVGASEQKQGQDKLSIKQRQKTNRHKNK